MSRLKVGGLALIIVDRFIKENEGKVVTLIRHLSTSEYDDIFEVSCESGIIMNNGSITYNGGVGYPAKQLMPLGDKETQDELLKEITIKEENKKTKVFKP